MLLSPPMLLRIVNITISIGDASDHPIIYVIARGRPKPSMKPILLSKYPGTPNLKGLKGIAETCIQENNTGFRQESTSRVVVRSSRSIGMFSSCFYLIFLCGVEVQIWISLRKKICKKEVLQLLVFRLHK
ncbi:hypothetical protein P8452_42376 [Trifolium repens]|nr:hypothetical protein P8452_42376 [Trifolium repens]